MRARNVMTRDVVTVSPDTTIIAAARLMSERRVSGLPVVGPTGQLVGIISETDLLHRAELGTERQRNWWLRLFAEPDRLAREYAKSHGVTVSDVMSTALVTVDAEDDLAKVADMLERHNIKRVPVLENHVLVGIITRGDLVRAFAQHAARAPAKLTAGREIEQRINQKLKTLPWLDSGLVRVDIEDDRAVISGIISSADQRRALRVLVSEEAEGRTIEDRLRVGRFQHGSV